jgi:hypothetical protein
MKIVKLSDNPKVMLIIPRIFPNIGDNLSISIREEFKNKTQEVEFIWDYVNNYLNIYLSDDDFYELYSKYEIVVKRESTIIYRGKLMVIGDDDSIQDFKRSSVVNKKIII